MVKPVLFDYFERYAKILMAFYEHSSLQGASDNLGANREFFHNNFLKRILPTRLLVCKGEIWDSKGNKTGQLDIIIISDDIPIFSFEGERDTLPIEGVFAVIEVKSNLTRDKLVEAGKTLEKVRDLVIEYPGIQSGAGFYSDHPFRIVFAFEGATEKTIIDEIISQKWYGLFDLICILNRGVYQPNKNDSELASKPYIFSEGTGVSLAILIDLLVTSCQGYVSRRIVLDKYLEPWDEWTR